jgi:hypothetical protein
MVNIFQYCHNPTNNTKQNKTTWLVWYYIGKKTTTPHHHTGMITFLATSRQPRKEK